jgi:hypothetical protein
MAWVVLLNCEWHCMINSEWWWAGMKVGVPLLITVDPVILCELYKAVPLQAWSGPEGSRKLRFPDFMTVAQDGGKVVNLTHRPPLPPGNKYTWYSFLLEAELIPGP